MKIGSKAALGAILAGAIGSAASGNIVTNGGFETGDFTAWGTQAGFPVSSFGVLGGFGHLSQHTAFFDGSVFAELDEIFQTLPTAPGQQYTLEFWVHNYGAGSDALRVQWEGNTILLSSPLASPLEDWFLFSLNVTATAPGSQLRIGGFDASATWYLDDVSVTEVPAPGAAALLGFGAIFGARRRR